MMAVLSKLLSDLRRRKLQTTVVLVVVLLSSFASTLALSLAVQSDAPFDHAFSAANGAHIVLTFASRGATPSLLRKTSRVNAVTGSVGPWPEVTGNLVAGPGNLKGGAAAMMASIVGRPNSSTPIDRLSIAGGRWASHVGEIVLSQHAADQLGLGVGGTATFMGETHHRSLRVVGIAASIDPTTDSWVAPAEISALGAGTSGLQYQMQYRVRQAGTSAQLHSAVQSIAARLPAGSVVGTSTYLDVKRNADLLTAVMVPFLMAFSVFGLIVSFLIITNVVSGAVIAGYRDIGIMKSVGFTPGQVVWELLGQILLPALFGAGIGVVCGTLASHPFLESTAHALGLPTAFTAEVPVDVAVVGMAIGIAALAGLLPAWRAAHMSAVAAIAAGTSPPAEGGQGFYGCFHIFRFRAPLPWGLRTPSPVRCGLP